MNRLYSVLVLCYVCLVAFILLDLGEAHDSRVVIRPKRYLSFFNITRFYLKINFKANMVPWNQLFAQALGFRINWDDPPNNFRGYHRLYRRNVYDNMEILFNRNGLNGFHCVRRAVCEMAALNEPEELYHKILYIVFRQQSSATEKWRNTTEHDCQLSASSCPFSFLEISRYTDVI